MSSWCFRAFSATFVSLVALRLPCFVVFCFSSQRVCVLDSSALPVGCCCRVVQHFFFSWAFLVLSPLPRPSPPFPSRARGFHFYSSSLARFHRCLWSPSVASGTVNGLKAKREGDLPSVVLVLPLRPIRPARDESWMCSIGFGPSRKEADGLHATCSLFSNRCFRNCSFPNGSFP